MQLGISVTSAYRRDDIPDLRSGARFMIERARAARDARFDSLFVGDHHVTPEPYYQNVPMIGRMLAEWNERTAGALFLLPLWNPVLLAEQVATLACIHNGPFVLQCGLGRDRAQFEGMGADIRYRPSAFEESLAALQALWRGEEITLSKRFNNRRAKIAPLPPQPIEIWIAASAPVAIERAARLGDGWLAEPSVVPKIAAERVQQYLAACARWGKKPGVVGIRRDVYVGADYETAQRDMAPILSRGYRGIDPQALVIGDVDSVADAFAALAEQGYQHICIRNISPDQTSALLTIERLARVRERILSL